MIDPQPLQNFVAWWQQYGRGDEKGEAQIFLDRLFTALGYEGGLRGAGGSAEQRIKFTLDEGSPTRFADLVIPGRVIVEMKKRGEDLQKHHQQAVSYWLYLTPHPRYVVLCNFDEFWVYDMERQIDAPMGKVHLADLPTAYGPLAFLFPTPQTPVFNREFDLIGLTEQAASSLSEVFKRLARRDVDRQQAQRFILQCMVALFAEDIELMPRYTFTRVIEDSQNGADSYDLFMNLFNAMNRPGVEPAGRFKGVPYFNGGIFSEVNPIQLTNEELRLLREAANHNWAKINPAIFGTIFEDSMNKDERHQTGAHFTSERDIMRIVEPVIVRPFQQRLAAATTADELRALHAELCAYRVLDPACGSGNFLYVAFRQMKKLESQILDSLSADSSRRDALLRVRDEGEASGGGVVSARQFFGFDINPFAVELAKVTLMIAKKLAADETHSGEAPLPLDRLDDNIRAADALFEDWPPFDAVIGNPPYLGAKRLKVEHGVEYVNNVRAAFPDVPGNADYCVYWFRKAHDLMPNGARAGLVGTNTIRQNYSRIGGLDYIVANDGHIFEAVSSMPWSGQAVVHVSIACWSKGELPFQSSWLWINDGIEKVETRSISTSLSQKTDVSDAKSLPINTEPKRVFVGQQTGHIKFVLTPNETREMLNYDPSSRSVIFPFLVGRDLTSKPSSKPSRYVIDMNDYDMMRAMEFRGAFKHLERHILPFREQKAKQETERNKNARTADIEAPLEHEYEGNLEQWWKHARGRTEDIKELQKLSRYIVCSRELDET